MMLFFLIFGISFLSVLCSFALLILNKVDRHANRLLAITMISMSISLIFNGLSYVEGFYVSYPYLYRLPLFSHYLLAPFLYLYVRATINRESSFRKWDWLHFLPALLHFIELIPFYLMPIDQKRDYVRFVFSHFELFSQQNEGLLPPNVHPLLKTGSGILYVLFQFRFLFFTYKNKIEWVKKNKLVWNWFIFLTSSYSLMYISVFFILIFKVAIDFRAFSLLAVGSIYFFCVIYLFFSPNVLYGIGQSVYTAPFLVGDNNVEVINKKFILSIDKKGHYKQKVEAFIENERPYLNKKFSIRDFANACDIPEHHLSIVINEDFGCAYTDFINKYRVNFIINNRYKGDWNAFSIEGLASEAGFNSRNSFLIAFKKVTGDTPSVYFAKYKTVETNNFIKT